MYPNKQILSPAKSAGCDVNPLRGYKSALKPGVITQMSISHEAVSVLCKIATFF